MCLHMYVSLCVCIYIPTCVFIKLREKEVVSTPPPILALAFLTHCLPGCVPLPDWLLVACPHHRLYI